MMKRMKKIQILLFLAVFLSFSSPVHAAMNGAVEDFEGSSLFQLLGLKKVAVHTFTKADQSQKKRYRYSSNDGRYTIEVNCSVDDKDIWMQSIGMPMSRSTEESYRDAEVLIRFAEETSGGKINNEAFAGFIQETMAGMYQELKEEIINGYRAGMFVSRHHSYWAVDIRKPGKK